MTIEELVDGLETWITEREAELAPVRALLEAMRNRPAEVGRYADHRAIAIELASPDQSVMDLELSMRTYNALRAADILTLGQLTTKTERDLLDLWNFGQKGLSEVVRELAKRNLKLKSRSA